MKQQLLLLEDVEALGKKGEVVSAKAGYIRNFLLPKGYATVATPNMLRKQERLRVERAKQAVVDKREAEVLAEQIKPLSFEIRVKVDPEGHMYGSVAAGDIEALFKEQNLPLTKKNIQLTRPIKTTGLHDISLRLKEGVALQIKLKIIPEGVSQEGLESVVAPLPTEAASADEKPAEE